MFDMGPSRLFGATCDKNAKNPRRTGGPGPPGRATIGIFGPKTRGGPCADLPRSFGIILSPQNRKPTMFVNDVHKTKIHKKSNKNMKRKLFGHLLKTRAHGTVSVYNSVTSCTISTNRELCTTKWHPSYDSCTVPKSRQTNICEKS